MRKNVFALMGLLLMTAALLPASTLSAAVLTMQAASVDSAGVQANAGSNISAISEDGNYVAFVSFASNLVPNDTNGISDVFVRDLTNGTTERVSVNSGGAQATGGGLGNQRPAISADGRYVAFESDATNLVAGDTNGVNDIFVHDRNTGTTVRASVNNAGTEGNGASSDVSISDDGRFVSFSSEADNLVGGDSNSSRDIFVRDLTGNTTERVSVNNGGVQGDDDSVVSSISETGQFVAFQSLATNLVAGDSNNNSDVFVRDRLGGTTERVSISTTSVQGDDFSGSPSISDDGRYVAFSSVATTLVVNDTNSQSDVFVRDRTNATTERISQTSAGAEGDDQSRFPSISADGRYVAFDSEATNLVTGDTNVKFDVFIADRMDGSIERASTDTSGVEGNDNSNLPSLAGDGATVAFQATATNLIANDANGTSDIFVATLGDPPIGEMPLRLYPADGATLVGDTDYDWPQFTFQHIDGIEWYQIWVGLDDYSSQALFQWYPATEASTGAPAGSGICDTMTDICTIPTDLWIINGDYEWWMTYWGPDDMDFNNYWNATTFTVNFGTPAGFVLTSPADGTTVNAEPMTIEWERNTDVLWYQIWVGPNTYATSQYFAWVDATEACDDTVCSVDVSGQTFTDGDYEVWAELWGPNGYVTWLNVNSGNAAATFTVSLTAAAPEFQR